MDTEIGFESPAAFRAFTEELAAAVAADRREVRHRRRRRAAASASSSDRIRPSPRARPRPPPKPRGTSAAARRLTTQSVQENVMSDSASRKDADTRDHHRRADRSGVEGDLRRRGADALVRRGGDRRARRRRHDHDLVGRRARRAPSRSKRGSRTRSCASKLAPIDMGKAEVRRRTDGRRVHDRAARRQDGAAAGELGHSGRDRSGTASTTAPTPAGRRSSARCATISSITAASRARRSRSSGQLPGSLEDAWATLRAGPRVARPTSSSSSSRR